MNKKFLLGVITLSLLAGCSNSDKDLKQVDKELENLREKYELESTKSETKYETVDLSKKDVDNKESTELKESDESKDNVETKDTNFLVSVTNTYEGDLITILDNKKTKGFLIENNIVGINSGNKVTGGNSLEYIEHKYNDEYLELYFTESAEGTANYLLNSDISLFELPQKELDLNEIKVFVNNSEIKEYKK